MSLANNGRRLVMSAGSSAVSRTVPVDSFKSAGKWYGEIRATNIFDGGTTTNGIGVTASDFLFSSNNLAAGTGANLGVGIWPDSTGSTNRIYRGGNFIVGIGIVDFADNDVLMFAMDIDNRLLWIGVNGTWHNSGNPAAGTNATVDSTYLAASKSWSMAASPWSAEAGSDLLMDVNSGASECVYAAPSGFSYW
jgi:hypothetical protein